MFVKEKSTVSARQVKKSHFSKKKDTNEKFSGNLAKDKQNKHIDGYDSLKPLYSGAHDISLNYFNTLFVKEASCG